MGVTPKNCPYKNDCFFQINIYQAFERKTKLTEIGSFDFSKLGTVGIHYKHFNKDQMKL